MAGSEIVRQQYPESAPLPAGLGEATNPLLVPASLQERLAHFPEGIYDTSATSHLSRILKVLLGDAGIGQVRKRYLLARIQQTLQGSHFQDLDRFYGALFALRRRSVEQLDIDPAGDVATSDEWQAIHAKDASYRSRIEQFARALVYGGSPTGTELAAEALLNVDVDVYESFVVADTARRTYGAVATLVGTYGGAEAYTYGDLEGEGQTDAGDNNRWTVTVRPKRTISLEEKADVLRVLRRIQPVFSRAIVDDRGVAIHTDAPIHRIIADSNYWEIRSPVRPSDDVSALYERVVAGEAIEQPRPAFSAYQGEAWTYNGDIIGVIGYSQGSSGIIDLGGRTRVHYAVQTHPFVWGYIDFMPYESLADLATTMAGRAVSDAMLVSSPYSRPRTNQGLVGRGDVESQQLLGRLPWLWVDNVSLSSAWTYWINQGSRAPQQRERFWATPERHRHDPTREVVEFRFTAPRLINHISFEVSRFPHVAAVEVWDAANNLWERVASFTVYNSQPSRIEEGWVSHGPFHPHHNHPAHWVKYQTHIGPKLTTKVRIVQQRFSSAACPRDRKGQFVPFSLAIKNVDIGYRVTSINDVPRTPTITGLGEAFADTKDIFGSLREMRLYRESAAGLSEGVQWRSEPQPIPQAVVNMYVDVRQASGDGQVIERFYLDPLTSGPHLSLYYSDGPMPTDQRWEADDTPIFPPTLDVHGTVVPSFTGLEFSESDPSWIDINNSAVQWDAGGSWWIAQRIQAAVNLAMSDEFVLFSWGQTDIYWVNNTLWMNSGGIVQQLLADVVLPGSGLMEVVFGHDAEAGTFSFGAWTADSPDGLWQTGSIPEWGNDLDRRDSLRIGARIDGDITPANFTLLAFLLKAGESGTASFDSIVNGGGLDTDFFVKSEYHRDQVMRTDNALVRFHAELITDVNPYGFEGGPGSFYALLDWKPVGRDYTLQKGYIQVPPTMAKFWKFEFTNLTSMPYESFVPVARTVRIHSTATVSRSVTTHSSGFGLSIRIGRDYPSGWGIHIDLQRSGTFTFKDTVLAATTVTVQETDLLSGAVLAESTARSSSESRVETTALYVQNFSIFDPLRFVQALFGFIPHQQGTLAPQFYEEGPHTYEYLTVTHSTKVAFFVGLHEIKAYRIDYLTDDDTLRYRELFHDDHNIDVPYTFEFDPNRLYSDVAPLPAVATSKVYQSNHRIEALQFATHQNDPVQIVPDDDFRDPALTSSTWDDDNGWHTVGDARANYSAGITQVTLSRTAIIPPPVTGGFALEGMEQPLPHPVQPNSPLAGGMAVGEDGPSFGGIETPLLTPSGGGRVHAAVRFTPVTDLSRPWTLEIISSDGTTLASKLVTGKAGETVEECLTYEINSYVGHYQSFASPFNPPRTLVEEPFNPGFKDTHLTLVGVVAPPTTGSDDILRVRFVQYGDTADVVRLDTLSTFDESIVWEFSVDSGNTWVPAYGVRNFINGVVVFPKAGRELRWRVTAYRENMNITSLQIRPWYVGRLHQRTKDQFRGPNVSAFDQEPPIESDPEFTTWNKPVPRTWYLTGKPFYGLPPQEAAPTNEYSAFFGRAVEENLGIAAPMTDAATRQAETHRQGYVVYDPAGIPHEVPGEPLLQPDDHATRTVISIRDGTDSVPGPVDEGGGFSYAPEEDPINKRPLSPP